MDSDVDMAREAKDISDRTMSLLRELDSLSLDERLNLMRNTAGAMPPEFQLREYIFWQSCRAYNTHSSS